MRILTLIGLGLIIGASALTSSCATISEDDCLAGNWAERGLKDGRKGVSRARLSEYTDKCSKYSASVDRTAYLREYERGLISYCVYDKGYDKGVSGGSFNTVCTGELAVDYGTGYEDGQLVYNINKEHERLVKYYHDKVDDILAIEAKQKNPDNDLKEQKRLKKKHTRSLNELDDLRDDVRRFEWEHDLPKYDFT